MFARSLRQLRRPILQQRWAHIGHAHANLRAVTSSDVEHFTSILSPSSVLSTLSPVSTASAELDSFNSDWMGKYRGRGNTVLKPRSTAEVARIVKYCNEHRIGIVPQGGNTGLVGGSIPVGAEGQEVVLNLGAMKDVRSFDPNSGILVADAGCVLESLSTYLEPHGYIMPLDLGAKGSCQIGGNVSTNAGGLRLLRYGSLHGSVLGLEVVLPDGTVLDQLSTLRKDNTGYDLKQLFIGAEGTLGIVTGVSILTPPASASINNVLLALPHFDNVVPLYRQVRRRLGEILSAFEFFDRQCYDLVLRHGQQPALPSDEVSDAQAFVLLETSGGHKEHDEAKLGELLEELLGAEGDAQLVTTGVLAQSQEQFNALWRLREGITESIGREGKAYKYDISIPVPKFKEAVDTVRERLRERGVLGKSPGGVSLVLGYGHVGDGNLHLNVVADSYTDEINDALEPFIFEMVSGYRGSVSAEHGIGSAKVDALKYSKGDASRLWMKKIKDLFDPNGIMNPGKVLPP
ncbi:FAD-binding domain-containing protein [Exidia glandulosa HHB12029]|uniref:FAD-binding domain-containing protein n=1 Tax=Exidia glandulosa HHB12029 TaxID=1314781 RepID=A0A165I801_EXIGL|nr:FAD-binding domain-containing protein [Exidia glandulosa HHB12029]